MALGNKEDLYYFRAMKKIPTPKLIKDFFISKGFGIKSAGAFLFWMFESLLPRVEPQLEKRIKNLGTKALNNLLSLNNSWLMDFTLKEFIPDFRDWLSHRESHYSKHPLKLCIDATKLGEHYGKAMPGLKKLYDYVQKRNINTHQLFVLQISLGKKEYIPCFILVDPKKGCGNYEAMTKMIEKWVNRLPADLKNDFYYLCKIALDGAWGHAKVFEYFEQTPFRRIAIKSGGTSNIVVKNKFILSLVEYKKLLIGSLELGNLQWTTPKKCHNLPGVQYYTQVVTFHKNNVPVRLVLVKYQKQSQDKPRYLLLLANVQPEWHAYRVIQTYHLRWPIETMFRTKKQKLDLTKYQFHAKLNWKRDDNLISTPKQKLDEAFTRLEGFIALRLIAYMAINWYRCENTRFKKTPLKQVIERWKIHFESMNNDCFQKLFSG